MQGNRGRPLHFVSHYHKGGLGWVSPSWAKTSTPSFAMRASTETSLTIWPINSRISSDAARRRRKTCRRHGGLLGKCSSSKPHGAGRQWRWILHSPSIHVDVGLGKLTHVVAKARLSSAFLWEHEIGTALTLLYGFLADFLEVSFTLQVSEAHLCVDVAAWELSLEGVSAYITRSRSKGLRLFPSEVSLEEDEEPFIAPRDVRLQFAGRRLATLDFSNGAPHACCIYDKTAEISVSRKDWMQEVWTSNGWDGEARVTRVEFRYKRECLREMKVEEAYAFLDQIPSLWAYSTKQWLRHTIPNGDPNRARWPLSPLWNLMQQASFFCDGTPAVRERRRAGDLTLLCQMIAGCSTSAAAFLTQVLPTGDNGTHFLIWFWDWLERYLIEKGVSFD
jgi:hypothetical protein